MTRVSVDDQVSEFSVGTEKKVGEFLHSLVATLPPNKIIHEVMLDGEPLARYEEASLESPLDGVREVQVRTVDKEIWAAAGLDMAICCVGRIQRSLIRASEMFREDDKVKANAFFVQCVEGLERFLETIMITRVAMRLDFNRISSEGRTLAQIQHEFSLILKGILQCQEAHDYNSVADRLEYELLTNLCSWSAALKQLRNSVNSNA